MPQQTYFGFNPNKEPQIKNSFKNVRTLLGKARLTLHGQIHNKLPSKDKTEQERFTKWFGTYTVANATHVFDRLHLLTRQLGSQRTAFLNAPTSNSVAYVRVAPGQNFGTQAANYADAGAPALVPNAQIFIGKAFYTAPLLGRDSQVGTIIHELSHLVCNTEDVPNPAGGNYANGFADTYGEANCMWLASNHDAQARHNADNYLFYCCSFPLQ